ncbi:uncharacterized protein LOC144111336 isoform X2 [Amblyomma americanum]
MRAPTPIEDVSLCDCVAGFPFTGCASAFLEDADAHFGCGMSVNRKENSLMSIKPHTQPDVPAYIEGILSTLNVIKKTQQSHSELLSTLMKDNTKTPLEPGDLPDLPFTSRFAFEEYDKDLKTDEKARHRMMYHMTIQGGNSTKERTCRVLRSIFSSAVAADYSWYGAKGKQKFCALNICKLMCSALTGCEQSVDAKVTLKEVEKSVMSWLRHAPVRAAAEERKSSGGESTLCGAAFVPGGAASQCVESEDSSTGS